MDHVSPLKVVGVDVSKDLLDAYWLPEADGRCAPNQAEAVQSFVAECLRRGIELVCVEATGGLERLLVKACHAAGLPIAVVNPRQIRDFAKAMNRLAKTDQLDCQTIALFAARMRPPATLASSENADKLGALTTRRKQVSDMLIQEKNRLHRTYDTHVEGLIRQAIDWYQQQLDQIEREIEALIRQTAEFQAKVDLMQTVPGIGATTAAMLVAKLPELGHRTNNQLSRTVGVAPLNRDSGQFRGKRMTGGGRSELRQQLFMPTLVAVRHNPKIRAFYQRLIQHGKPKMVALIAAMRKLLTCLNAMLKTGQPWKYA